MSAPAPSPTPTPAQPASPASGGVGAQVLLAALFAAVGFVAIWQGFGFAGYGTDAHAARVAVAVFALFVAGLIVVRPRTWLAVRAFVVLVGLGLASWAWWEVPNSLNMKSRQPLRDAVGLRDFYKQRLTTATVDDFEQHRGFKGIGYFFEQYPSLTKELAADYDRWKAAMADEIVARYGRTPHDTFKTIAVLRGSAKSLAEVHPSGAERVEAAFWQWLLGARNAKLDELRKLPLGDWAAFDQTADGRKALADAFPEARDVLVRAENEWVDSAIELTISNNLTPKPGALPTRHTFWNKAHADVLALKALDAGDGRFRKTRERLFVVAHDAAKAEITARLGAGEYDVAFGVARTHAVAFHSTATILGAEEVNKLDRLRETCEFFAVLAAKAVPPADAPDVAPPPRTKP